MRVHKDGDPNLKMYHIVCYIQNTQVFQHKVFIVIITAQYQIDFCC